MVTIFPCSFLSFVQEMWKSIRVSDSSWCSLVLGILRLNRARRSGLIHLCVIGRDWTGLGWCTFDGLNVKIE